MNRVIGLLGLFVFLISCNKDLVDNSVKDLTPYEDEISIKASNTIIPLNEYGVANFKAITDLGGDVTNETTFYINGEKLTGTAFIPKAIGKYAVMGIYKDLVSADIQIEVQVPLNKKVIIESFTSKACGWCPWIGGRVDSLHNANPKIISYTIHGQDEFEFDASKKFENYLEVYGRPTVRVNRESLKNFTAQTHIKGLVDSINYYLSSQPSAELAIESTLNEQTLDVEVFGKFYGKVENDLYLTAVLVEDGLVTNFQDNYFSGGGYTNCPYNDKPNPIPDYENHNVLRKFLTDITGDAVQTSSIEGIQEKSIAKMQLPMDQINLKNMDESYIIVFLHERKEDVTSASVINAQIVKVGQSVSFEE